LEAGVKLPELENNPHGVATPGFNPKDSAESYVRKIL
jgi:hypothetical protein